MSAEPSSESPTPLEQQRDLVEGLHAAAAARAAGERDEDTRGRRERDLNARMHRTAGETLAQSYDEQVADAARAFDAEVERIESAARDRLAKVKADEATLRKKAASDAEQAEEDLQRAYDEKVWMAESVYEAAIPAIRKAAQARLDEAKERAARIDAIIESGHSAVRGYRQRTLRLPASEGTDASLGAHLQELEPHLVALRSCKAAGLFRGPILVIPLALLLVAGAVVGAKAGPGGLIGAAAGFGLFLVLAGTLYGVARAEVKRAYLPFLRTAARARASVEGAIAEIEAAKRTKEDEARRVRDADLAKADARFKPGMSAVDRQLNDFLAQLKAKVPHYEAKVMKQRAAELRAAEEARDARIAEAGERRRGAEAEEADRHREVADTVTAREAGAKAGREQAWRTAQQATLDAIARLNALDAQTTHPWDDDAWQSWDPPRRALPAVRLGALDLALGQVPDALPADPALAWSGADRDTVWRIPAFIGVPERMSLVVEGPPERRTEGLRILQNALARILVSLPPGKARFTLVDPVGLGQSFAGFMHLADEMEALVTDRIWTDVRHIEQRLADLTEHMETVIQKYLRNEYASIEAYNEQAGEIAEPYRILVMADFPTNVSDQAAKRFASILQSGARCGVHVLLLRDLRAALPPGLDASDLRRGTMTIAWNEKASGWRIEEGKLAALPFWPDSPPDDAFLQRITRIVGRAAKDTSRVEVPFSSVMPRPEERWTLSTSKVFRVPLGRSGASRLQYMTLGEGTSQHALIAGKTGSGKSSLLNALIVNTALWYSPDEVEFWLIDFKKGVEFKAYASSNLPHARAVAVESDREFGLSVLAGLDEELRRRGELYRAAGVQNLSDWRALGRTERMPRCLLVIDEFQELFIEDDKVSQDASLLLDRLVRQGRAFGMHVILGSQTLGGAYSIARSTMGQMGVRIALQCTETDSQLILSDDNTAARLLSRPGEAIYNDAGGLLEGNSPFQVVWIGDEERDARLREVTEVDRARRSLPRPRPIVFEGNQPADAMANAPLLAALAEPTTGRAAFAPKAWLGDAVSIKEPTHATFVRRTGANVAIVGQRDEGAAAILGMAMIAIAAQTPIAGTRIVVLDGTTPDDRLYGSLDRIRKALPHDVQMPSFRELPESLEALGKELAERTASGTADAPGIFLLVNGVHRFRALRRNEDDYSFSASDGPPSPDKLLALLLREGPAVGIHTMLWADTVANLQRTVDRAGLRELENKVLFQVSVNDSSTLIDSAVASRLGFHRALLAVEETGLQEKFRPYALPDDAFLAMVAERLRART